jgi:hypothetical protein
MLTAIAFFYLSFPGFLPADPPMHPRLLPPHRVELCHTGACAGKPIR